MPTPITLPQLAETTHEGTVGRWLKQVGDTIKRYEPLVEILTDKVNVEMTSPYSGVISAINVAEGETLLVGGVLATVDEDGSTAEAAPAAAAPAPAAAAAPAAAVAAATAEGPGSVRRGEGRQRITPVVARLAQQHGVDIGLLRGTGVDGRVTKQDLLDYVAQQEQQSATAPAPVAAPAPAAAPPAAPAAPVAAGPDEEAVPLNPMRRAIAENMSRSKASIPTPGPWWKWM